jgi:hypothetical protein
MNSIEAFAEGARTGSWGLDDIVLGGFSPGLTAGEPLDGSQGVPSGVAVHIGEGQPLLPEQGA